MNIGIIQARMGSSRLPGKILLESCGESLFSHMLQRIQKSKNLDKIVVATTTNPQDDVIEKFCKTKKIDFFRGSEHDVLLRYYKTAKKFSADVVVRLTSDTPLLDAQTIDTILDVYENNEFNYVSNQFPFPRTYPDGYNVEVFSFELLQKINEYAKKPSDREHVTTFITMQPKIFKIFRVDYKKDLSKYRFNLDYQNDYQLIKSIFEGLHPINPYFTLDDIIIWLEQNPDVLKLNENIKPYQNILKSFEEDMKKNFKPYENNYYLDDIN